MKFLVFPWNVFHCSRNTIIIIKENIRGFIWGCKSLYSSEFVPLKKTNINVQVTHNVMTTWVVNIKLQWYQLCNINIHIYLIMCLLSFYLISVCLLCCYCKELIFYMIDLFFNQFLSNIQMQSNVKTSV